MGEWGVWGAASAAASPLPMRAALGAGARAWRGAALASARKAASAAGEAGGLTVG